MTLMTRRPPVVDRFIAAPREDVCIHFVNTRYWRGRETPSEELHGPEDLLRWSSGPGGIEEGVAAAFCTRWARHKPEAEAAFTTAIELREALLRLFGSAQAGEAAPADLATFNAALASAAPRNRMVLCDGRFVWSGERLRFEAASLLSPVLWSAADLLAGPRRARVRQCDNPECRWVFLDDSKSGNRRWCSMASCGNRAKAHRHYRKSKASQAGGAG